MRSIYRALFEVKIRHNYYNSGYSEDFKIEPTIECYKLLQKYHLLFRQNNCGFVLKYKVLLDANYNPASPEKPFVSINEYTNLSFKLKLKNSKFSNFTDLTALSGVSEKTVFYYDNIDLHNNASLNELVIPVKPSVFNFEFTSKKNEAQLIISDSYRQEVYKKILKETGPGSGFFKEQINLKGYDKGKYFFQVKSADIEEEIYIDNELISENCFGIINIISDSSHSFNYAKGHNYEIEFCRKSVQWKYYVVCKNDYPGLQIVDNAISPQYFFKEVIPKPDDNIRIFKSVSIPIEEETPEPLPFSEIPKKELQLRNDTNILIENLPNPTIDNPDAEIYIYI